VQLCMGWGHRELSNATEETHVNIPPRRVLEVLLAGMQRFWSSDTFAIMTAGRHVDDTVVEALRLKLLSPKTSLPQKYRVLFSLRNIAGEAARQALAEGETTSHPAAASAPCQSTTLPVNRFK